MGRCLISSSEYGVNSWKVKSSKVSTTGFDDDEDDQLSMISGSEGFVVVDLIDGLS